MQNTFPITEYFSEGDFIGFIPFVVELQCLQKNPKLIKSKKKRLLHLVHKSKEDSLSSAI